MTDTGRKRIVKEHRRTLIAVIRMEDYDGAVSLADLVQLGQCPPHHIVHVAVCYHTPPPPRVSAITRVRSTANPNSKITKDERRALTGRSECVTSRSECRNIWAGRSRRTRQLRSSGAGTRARVRRARCSPGSPLPALSCCPSTDMPSAARRQDCAARTENRLCQATSMPQTCAVSYQDYHMERGSGFWTGRVRGRRHARCRCVAREEFRRGAPRPVRAVGTDTNEPRPGGTRGRRGENGAVSSHDVYCVLRNTRVAHR